MKIKLSAKTKHVLISIFVLAVLSFAFGGLWIGQIRQSKIMIDVAVYFMFFFMLAAGYLVILLKKAIKQLDYK